MPRISEVLSQHEMMTMLCGYLSSADILHLAATSKEHWTYIKNSPQIFETLQANAVCDGLGIVAQQRLFGSLKFREDDKVRDHHCLRADARPCDDCGANVCDNCRFHFLYRCEQWSWSDSADAEQSYTEWIEDTIIGMQGTKSVSSVQGRKAFDIYWRPPEKVYCLPCHPLVRTGENPCTCSMYNHFVGERWLCIPCFLEEETVNIKRNYKLRPECWVWAGGDHCECGKPAQRFSSEFCRYCNGARGWTGQLRGVILDNIYDQLGYQQEKKGEMKAILEQLG